MASAAFPLSTMSRGAPPAPVPAGEWSPRRRRLAMGPRTIRGALRGGLPDPEATVRVPGWPKAPKPAAEDYDRAGVEEIALIDTDASEASDNDDDGAVAIGPALLPVFRASALGALLAGPARDRLAGALVARLRTRLLLTHQPRALCAAAAAVLLDVQAYNGAVLDALAARRLLPPPSAPVLAFRRASARLAALLRRLLDAYAREGAQDAAEYTELSRLKAGVLLLAGRVCQSARKLMDAPPT